MKKFLKWAGIVIGTLLVLIIIVAFYFNNKGKSALAQTFEVKQYDVELPSDSASLARGEYLVGALCRHCHSGDLGGMAFMDDPKIGFLPSSNLTPGKGSKTVNYTTSDWIRSIRHGIKPDGHGLMIMPSHAFHHMTESDLYSVVAYMKSIPPVDKEWPEKHFPFMSMMMAGMGMFGDIVPAAIIDHEAPFKTPVAEGETIEYGQYIFDISGCVDCHKSNLGGGMSPEPGAPPVPNISQASVVGQWSPEQFVMMMKTGKTPEGKLLNEKYMPWISYAQYTEADLRAIHSYIMSLPGVEDPQ